MFDDGVFVFRIFPGLSSSSSSKDVDGENEVGEVSSLYWVILCGFERKLVIFNLVLFIRLRFELCKNYILCTTTTVQYLLNDC